MPSPLSATTVSPRARGLGGELARVVEVARVDAAHGQPVRAQRPLDLRGDPAAPCRRRRRG